MPAPYHSGRSGDYNSDRHALARQNLENARLRAQQERGYNSQRTRQAMSDAFARRTSGMVPHDWQLDVAEALHLGLDCTVIAGTGAHLQAANGGSAWSGEASSSTVRVAPAQGLEEGSQRHLPLPDFLGLHEA
ncbi:hypothetical protein BV20DRAFT_962662 [Pilatotrama ljubarskyi]|nr:hypothetical protein BV20DRAFT_969544 [Pilatotrama ljubarskyi]KAI0373451.1 hypothetical protein BV20DRAFT_962606 [Pilatotrama ljubarskyi]KAI0373498.1 hypothetical protein BV20DRAFT_962662 [Pilatotrama ljubarskyi]